MDKKDDTQTSRKEWFHWKNVCPVLSVTLVVWLFLIDRSGNAKPFSSQVH